MADRAVGFPKLLVRTVRDGVLVVFHLGPIDEVLGPVVSDIPIRPVPDLHPLGAGAVEGEGNRLVNLDLLLTVRAAQNYLQPAVL